MRSPLVHVYCWPFYVLATSRLPPPLCDSILSREPFVWVNMKTLPAPFTSEISDRPRSRRTSLTLTLALLSTLGLVSCGATSNSSTSGSGGGGATAQAQLSTSVNSVNFGNVAIGSPGTQPVTLTNSGNASLNISQATISGSGFSMSGITTPMTLTAGQNATVSVQFAPQESGSVTGTISLVSNATNSPTLISLSGTGVQPPSHSAALSWTASTSAVIGYNVYRGTESGGPYTKLNSSVIAATNYTDSTVQAGQTYYYVVTAVNSSDIESVYSNQVSAAIPTS
jgi:Abnormal spindle-like microcephaly-assoc'd, ASPM-SPD-2-Hydin